MKMTVEYIGTVLKPGGGVHVYLNDEKGKTWTILGVGDKNTLMSGDVLEVPFVGDAPIWGQAKKLTK